MKSLLVVAVFISLTAVARSETCIDGSAFNSVFNKCYQFFKNSLKYRRADRVCAGIGGRLVTVHNVFEQTFIYATAKEHFVLDFWLGLDDLANPGTWKWNDGSASSYFNWAPGFPANVTTQQCVRMRISDGKWENVPCDHSTTRFVCEVDAKQDDPPKDCPTGGSYFAATKQCFFFIDAITALDEGIDTCGEMSMFPACLDTAAKESFVSSEAIKKGMDDYWLGLEKNEKGGWDWMDKSTFGFTFWDNGFPNDPADYPEVAARGKTGKWYNNGDIENVLICGTKP